MKKFVLENDLTIELQDEEAVLLPKDTIVEFVPMSYLRNLGCLEPFKGKHRLQQREYESMKLEARFISEDASGKFEDGTFTPDFSCSDNCEILWVEELDYFELAEFMNYFGIVLKDIEVIACCPDCKAEQTF